MEARKVIAIASLAALRWRLGDILGGVNDQGLGAPPGDSAEK
jgi:hypothetical protein